MATHTLTITGFLPPTLNQLMRGKLRRRMRLEKACRNVVAVHVFASGIPKATGRRRVSLRFDHGPGVRRPDCDSYQKVLLDSLKASGVIRDDSPVWLELGPVRLERGPADATTIVVEDL